MAFNVAAADVSNGRTVVLPCTPSFKKLSAVVKGHEVGDLRLPHAQGHMSCESIC